MDTWRKCKSFFNRLCTVQKFARNYGQVFERYKTVEKGFEIESFDRENNFLIIRGIDWPKFKLLIKISRENNTWLIDGCGSININESIIK